MKDPKALEEDPKMGLQQLSAGRGEVAPRRIVQLEANYRLGGGEAPKRIVWHLSALHLMRCGIEIPDVVAS